MASPGKNYRGIVVPGRGFGAQRMANPSLLQVLQRFTNLTLVPGTLNVRLPQPFDGTLTGYLTEDDLGGNVWRDHAPDRRVFDVARCSLPGNTAESCSRAMSRSIRPTWWKS